MSGQDDTPKPQPQTTHHLTLTTRWYDKVRYGEKLYEGRLFDSLTRQYHIGDFISLTDATDESKGPIVVAIESMHVFQDFDIGLSHIGLSATVPGCDTHDEAVEIYQRFYSIEQQRKWNVVFIAIRHISDPR